jgi:hypothetical protein
MTGKHTDATRRRLVAETAQLSPRGTGRKVVLEVTLYGAGHSVINSTPRTQSIMSNDDAELVAQFALMIRNVRKQMP